MSIALSNSQSALYCNCTAGNEPLGTGAVKLGAGTAAEAKAAAQEVCSQLVMLGGVLNLTSALGPRTANVKNVAYNRSMAVGASIKEVGAATGCVTPAAGCVGSIAARLSTDTQQLPSIGVSCAGTRSILSHTSLAAAHLHVAFSLCVCRREREASDHGRGSFIWCHSGCN